MLGRALESRRSEYDEAEDLLTEALAIQEHVFGRVHPRVASALNDLGNVAMGRGPSDRSRAGLPRIGEIYRSVYGDKHYLVGIATSNLAGVYMARNDYATAERMYRDAVALFSRGAVAGSSEHGHRPNQARSIAASPGAHADAEREAAPATRS